MSSRGTCCTLPAHRAPDGDESQKPIGRTIRRSDGAPRQADEFAMPLPCPGAVCDSPVFRLPDNPQKPRVASKARSCTAPSPSIARRLASRLKLSVSASAETSAEVPRLVGPFRQGHPRVRRQQAAPVQRRQAVAQLRFDATRRRGPHNPR